MTINPSEVEDALLDLEGLLYAIERLRLVEDAVNKPGPEFHALAVLSRLSVEQAAKLRLAIFPELPKREEAAP
jgi:hypothetical protein